MSNLTIGDTNRTGLVQVTDTRWDSNGATHVTVREMIGGHNFSGWFGGKPRAIRAMRDTAKQAVERPDKTQWTRLDRVWFADGVMHATFTVSRLDPSYR